MTHNLKIWPLYFKRILYGEKKFEVRKNDRDFQVGDTIILNEYDPETKTYTDNNIRVEITYILNGGQFGIEPGYCVMSLNII